LKEAALKGIPIGQLLVEQGALTQRQVDHILHVQKESHRPFGDLAERLYGINPRAVEDAWVEQYTRTVGLTDLDEQQIDEDCLRLLNRRQAWQFHTLPVNRDVDNLNIATSPENLVRAVNFSTRKLDEPISFLLAEREQLREFLMKHYPVPEHIADFSLKL
jgi:Type II secretion system (T2SS), protein E, N-terminal domain